MEYIFIPKEFNAVKTFISKRHINVESPYHINYEMEFIVVTKGTVVMQIQGEVYKIEKGQACYVMPFEPHSFDTAAYSECHVLMFESNVIKYFFEFLTNHKPDSRVFEISDDIISIIDRILPNGTNTADMVDALSCLAPICAEIKRQRVFVENKNRYSNIFLQALSIANECYTSQITLESVAKQIGIDPATLSRNFSQNAKVTFNTYLNALRVHHAASQILETENTFTEIAYSSGFGSIRNFNRMFKKYMNRTPSQFKNNPTEISGQIHM